MQAELIAGGVSLVTVSLLLPLTAIVLRRGGVYDQPSGRSSHSTPTPRGAGAAQLCGVSVSWGAVGWVPSPGVLAPIAFGLLGLLDDLRAQRPMTRLAVQLFIGAFAAVTLLNPTAVTFSAAVVLLAGTGLFVVAVNSANFMDGINGISALHGVLVGATYWWLLADVDSEWAPIAAALVGASLAFLPWNWGVSARLFLGDSGSYLLGALMASFCITAINSGVKPLIALAPLAVYLVDVLKTIGERTLKRKSLLDAHRDHTYQRLIQLGLSHPAVALIVVSWSIFVVGVAWVEYRFQIHTGVVAILISVLLCAYLSLPSFVAWLRERPQCDQS